MPFLNIILWWTSPKSRLPPFSSLETLLSSSSYIYSVICIQGSIVYYTWDILEPDNDYAHTTWELECRILHGYAECISSNYLPLMFYNKRTLIPGVFCLIWEINPKCMILAWNRLGHNSLTKYFSSLKQILQDLDPFNVHGWKCPKDNTWYMTILDTSQVFILLAGLNLEFAEPCCTIIGRSPLHSINAIISEVGT